MNTYKLFLIDFVRILIQKLEESKSRAEKGLVDDYDKGIVMGYYESLDLIKQQANAFGIPLKEIGLADVPLEDYLYNK